MANNDALEEQWLNDDCRKLLKLRGYIREALLLAKSRKKDPLKPYNKNKAFIIYGRKTKTLIKQISTTLEELDDEAFTGLDPNVFAENWTEKDIKLFLGKNKAIEATLRKKILNEEKLIEELENNEKIAARWKKWISEPISTASESMHAFAYKFPFPPVDLIFLTLGGFSSFVAVLSDYQARRYNPGIKKTGKEQEFLIFTSVFGGIALTGVIIGTVFTGTAVAIITPILIAVGSTAIAIANSIAFGKSLVGLVKEIRTKEPSNTHKLRVLQKSLDSLRLAAATVFYACVGILAVVAVVALFANPIGLPVLAAAMFTIAIATSAVYIGSYVLGKIANWRINKIKAKTVQEESLKKNKNTQEETAHKHTSIKPAENTAQNTNQYHAGFHLMQEIAKHKPSVLVRTEEIPKQTYQQLAESSRNELEKKINSNNPLYEKVMHKTDPNFNTDQHALMIEVHSPGTTNEHHDIITRHLNEHKVVEIKLTTDPRNNHPSDNAIFILLDLNKEFEPLFMDHCGDPILALKVFEAAKLANMEITLDLQDRERLIQSDNPQLKAYFSTIESWSTEEFQAYTKEKLKTEGRYQLGQIPETVPNKPELHHPINTAHQ